MDLQLLSPQICYICTMKLRRTISILASLTLLLLLILPSEYASAQRYQRLRGVRSARWSVDRRGDSMLYVTFLDVNIYSRKRDFKQYERMVRAVKKVYPLALEAAKRMQNLDDELAELELRKDKKAYTRAIEQDLKEEISPMLWKMTRYEGKILLKLIGRETNHTVFGIIKDFRSGFTAGFYQTLAKLFGNNLKLEYDPEGEDEMLEQIVRYYKAGLL